MSATKYLILLSAKNEDRLYAYINKFLEFLASVESDEEPDIRDLAYTLQVGRVSLDKRMAFFADSLDDFRAKLSKLVFSDDISGEFDVFISDGFRSEHFPALQHISKLSSIHEDNLQTTIKSWVSGLSVDWRFLYETQEEQDSQPSQPQRVSLPTYPFAEESYWIKAESLPVENNSKVALLGPLLHNNDSDAYETRFVSYFNGDEFFLSDHRVNQQKILPGVAYLEMACQAFQRSLRHEGPLAITDVVWQRPLMMDDETEEEAVYTGFYPEDEKHGIYRVYHREQNGAEAVFSQGRVSVIEAEAPNMALSTLQSDSTEMSQPISDIYEAYNAGGLWYGEGHRGLVSMRLGNNQHGPMVLAKVELPASLSQQASAYHLHPSILDSALQAALGLSLSTSKVPQKAPLTLPFALSELRVYGQCPQEVWVWVRYSDGHSGDSDIEKLDITLCDDHGRICVEFKGFTSRVFKEKPADAQRLLFREQWQESAPQKDVVYHGRRLVIVAGVSNSPLAFNLGTEVEYIECANEDRHIAKYFESLSSQLFLRIKSLLKDGLSEPLLLQCVTRNNSGKNAEPCHRGISGLLKTASMEHPNLLVQHIQVENDQQGQQLSNLLQLNANALSDRDIRYRAGRREVLSYLSQPSPASAASWPEKGVFLITGGAGGLGLLVAREIAAQGSDVTLILTGRRPIDESIVASLAVLQASGAKVEYRQVDVTNPIAVTGLIGHIIDRYNYLSVVLHGAGVLADNFILNKDNDEFKRVMAPKVSGLVNLDEATRDLALSHFICFSSISALGSVGQADYAAANGFMDSYMRYRNALEQQEQRHGNSISINWPLWSEGGMGVDDAVQAQFRASGMLPLASDSGLLALRESLALGMPGLLVFSGDAGRIESEVLSTKQQLPEATTGDVSQLTGADGQSLQEKVEKMLVQQVSSLLKLRPDDLDMETELSDCGFDSISLTEFGNRLNDLYDISVVPTIFFEYPTLGGFAEYLLRNYGEVLSKAFKVVVAEAPKTPATVASSVQESSSESGSLQGALPGASSGATPGSSLRSSQIQISPLKLRQVTSTAIEPAISSAASTLAPALATPAAHSHEPVAVIGMSGAFPGAADINAFWEVLSEGRDCISEIPEERWDWQAIYGDPHKEPNKCNVKWGGFIADVDKFDPLFFGLSPREAIGMDPQQRLLMTHVWHALEDAGYAPSSLSGSNTAILLGTATSGYEYLATEALGTIEGHTATTLSPSLGPNRISYMLNLHGPSEPIETACSSALVALHRALGCLHKGDSDLAIAGGVNSIVSPVEHISFNKAGMLSEDGRCKTFSAQANGYVRGEGVGIVVLKPLSAAQRDHDQIYGVLLGSAENHGGKANSLTAPNAKAQSALLVKAYQDAGIDPRSVGYIEAHGTGTPLGDPVEINALKDAFSRLYKETEENRILPQGHCALGSVKTNIGHLELAAGIAGVIKVLLQLKHGQLVKSLHCDEINPYIEMENSPFYVVQEAQNWPAFKDISGKQLPRRAGVSSFGFGGVNAHVVLEEYPQTEYEPVILPVYAVVLSAKTRDQLTHQARQLFNWLDIATPGDEQLADIAYTLQLGRDAMEYRVAFTVTDVATLREQVQAFAEGVPGERYLGQVKREHGEVAMFNADEELRKVIKGWIARNHLSKLMELWVKGLEFDWTQLYPQQKPYRLSLPTYPFAKDRYWFESSESLGYEALKSGHVAMQHPLLHSNDSDAYENRFVSHFSGDEFFLSDHRVNQQRVLPGVAYLEMACQAFCRSLRYEGPIAVTDVVWQRPLIVEDANFGRGPGDKPNATYTGLYPEDDRHAAYQVYYHQGPDEVEVIFSQGHVCVLEEDAPQLPLSELKSVSQPITQSVSDIYDAYAAGGLAYGEGHRGIEAMRVSKDAASPMVLAQVSLPAPLTSEADEFQLHPSILDSALQASIGLTLSSDTDAIVTPLTLPFALTALKVYDTCPQRVWVYVRHSQEHAQGTDIETLDISLCDHQGQVCIEFLGFTSRLLKDSHINGERLLYRREWQAPEQYPSSVFKGRRLVITTGGDLSDITPLLGEYAQVIALSEDGTSLAERYSSLSCQVFAQIKGLLTGGLSEQVLLQCVTQCEADNGINGCYRGLSGLLKTAALEQPNLLVQHIEVEKGTDTQSVVQQLNSCASDVSVQDIRYRNGQPEVLNFIPHSAPDKTVNWPDRGVYLITGGAGGLGLLVARDIAQKGSGMSLILTGRRPIDDQISIYLSELRASGAQAEYHQVDVTDLEAVTSLVSHITEHHGALNVILHSAGVLADNFIRNKNEEEFNRVLAPKVAGLVNLDEATRHIALSHFIAFSSVSALGSVGQADYAAANGFMDSYMQYRESLTSPPKSQNQHHIQRHGQSLSINWPLWSAGGMGVDDAVLAQFRASGMVPLDTERGLVTLREAMAMPVSDLLVFCGEAERIEADVLSFAPVQSESSLSETSLSETSATDLSDAESSSSEGAQTAETDNASLLTSALNYFKSQLSGTLDLPVSRIDVEAPMERYGIDSVMVLQLTGILEKIFGPLPKTLFFEVQTIRALTDYFLTQHRESLVSLLDNSATAQSTKNVPQQKAPQHNGSTSTLPAKHLEPPTLKSKQFSRGGLSSGNQRHDIAIIGVSGRYPQSRDLSAYWENLQQGRDCISEIPDSRWDHSQYFHPDKHRSGSVYSKWGGFIEGVDQFDPVFFNVSPRDAELMDPQERLFLQCVYATLEDAGYTRQHLAQLASKDAENLTGRVGVFVGVMYEEYQLYGAELQAQDTRLALGGNPSAIANRVSYYCNWVGPSMAIDTMCSSSLTAIHLACHAIRSHSCEQAIAGGVNVSVHPNKYILLSQEKFAASNGRCVSFGEGGDGYVPGEGVGAVLLKDKAKAIADGDHIYGIVRGVSVNHGGKTNGFTVPNPHAQRDVISRALDDAGVNPRHISYIEAHGTGTPLGDPIEIAGLSKAFAEQTDDIQYCAIGSVKSNIGHCESAAGIAGVTKVLLQMQHKQLVPSLHSQTLNPNIDFSSTPFKVQQTLEAWEQPQITNNGVTRTLPRIAGVSSFGAGGSNAHVVIEEYETPVRQAVINVPVMIILSARTEPQLQQRASALLAVLEQEQYGDNDLAAIAHTLQVGREAMEHRLGLVVSDTATLIEALTAFTSTGKPDKKIHYYTGKASDGKDLLGGFNDDAAFGNVLLEWQQQGEYDRIVELWVKGLVFDWSQLYSDGQPGRVSLPTYPFDTGRYWFDSDLPNARKSDRRVQHSLLPDQSQQHPLLHSNESDAFEVCFASQFSGNEFFLSDHQVNQQKVLPGVAYLEMACQAFSRSLRQKGPVVISDVVWQRPLTIDDSSDVQEGQITYTALYPEDETHATFQVLQRRPDDMEIVFSRGRVSSLEEEAPQLPLSELQANSEPSTESVSAIYDAFTAAGLAYGEGHRGMVSMRMGKDTTTPTVLAQVSLPASLIASSDDYRLHPSILDSALQATIGMTLIENASSQDEASESAALSLPFALSELKVYDTCPHNVWVWVRHAHDHDANSDIEKLDISLCDEQGRVCVEFNGFTSRVVKEDTLTDVAVRSERLFYREQWQVTESETAGQTYSGQRLVIAAKALSGDLSSLDDDTELLFVDTEGATMAQQYSSLATRLFTEIKQRLDYGLSAPLLLQYVSQQKDGQTSDDITACQRGLAGLLKTAAMEQPKLLVQHIEVETANSDSVNTDNLALLLNDAAADLSHQDIRYRNGQAETLSYVPQTAPSAPDSWPAQGVYLITGGAGGLGLLVAQDIVKQVMSTETDASQVRLILTGRSAPGERVNAALASLRRSGAQVEYRQVDVTDAIAVIGLIGHIVNEYGSLTGVLHSAGILADNFIRNKTPEEFQTVLAPKVAGLVNLDEATRDIALTHFISFSSISALGSVGQADYAAANAFMDSYMAYRSDLQTNGKRHGQSLSVNWPLWSEGGMGVDEAVLAQLQSAGMTPLDSDTGLRALRESLTLNQQSPTLSSVLVFSGDAERIESGLLSIQQRLPGAQPSTTQPVTAEVADINVAELTSADGQTLQDKVEKMLLREVSALLKLRPEDVDLDTELSDYGFDSISLTEFGNRLNDQYGVSIAPTIFFEYPTLGGFADYLLQSEGQAMGQAFKVTEVATASAPKTAATKPSATPAIEKRTPTLRLRSVSQPAIEQGSMTQQLTQQATQTQKQTPPARDNIAIIGMSGAFPGAPDLNRFWDILSEGRDCISEIPKDRWDWEALYGDPHKEPNKCNVKWGGFIADVDKFDPLFFGLSPREAVAMEPQQRLLLTHVWQALEDAGIAPSGLSGSNTAVLLGTATSGYEYLATEALGSVEGYTATGAVPSLGPNRISYLLNLHGPSEPIETACSSALVALHRASGCLHNGDSDLAIAGGANSIVSPADHISFNKAGMLSEDGRCKTFSAQANGYVRGEGVGIVVLKRLKDAQRDHDHIYGVLLGSAENHGGRANSLTAPNVKAQSALLVKAYQQAGIDPRTVGYIEAHGTGTPLGDPVEINALKDAFSKLYTETESKQTERKQTENKQTTDIQSHCALGSVKTNIGHLELAAGIAGVIKVLLQLKHRQLVKSLHSDEINPYISLDNSPFHIAQEAGPWPVINDDNGEPLPRRAGVSSFGFGGVNAHVVLEEYQQETPEPVSLPVHAIVLSAKTAAQLTQQVQQLHDWLQGYSLQDQLPQESQLTQSQLTNMAYTLQTGRDALEHRIAFTVTDMADLRDQLQAYAEGQGGDWYQGRVKREQDEVSMFNADEGLRQVIQDWIARHQLSKLMELWVKGLELDWTQLYGDALPYRLSLPTYPFEKESYWFESQNYPGGQNVSKLANSSQTQQHPLLHSNDSDAFENRFVSYFSGEEFFLADHQVNQQKVLPGVAYLEMAYQAFTRSLRHDGAVAVTDVVWQRPLVMDDAAEDSAQQAIFTSLYPEDEENGVFRVYQSQDDQTHIFSQGKVSVLKDEAPTLSLPDLEAGSEPLQQSSITKIYDAYEAGGLSYGEGHRGLVSMRIGKNADEPMVLAKVLLPESLTSGAGEYQLHPAMLDSALQSAIGLTISDGEIPEQAPLTLPFALSELRVYGTCPNDVFVLVRQNEAHESGSDIEKLDISLCDEQGQVCVEFIGFTSRILKDFDDADERLFYREHWQQSETQDEHAYEGRRLVIMTAEHDNNLATTLGPDIELMSLTAEGKDTPKAFETLTLQLFTKVKSLLANGLSEPLLLQCVTRTDTANIAPDYRGLSALLKTAAMEQPNLLVQFIDIDTDLAPKQLAETLESNVNTLSAQDVRYREGHRETLTYQPQQAPEIVNAWPDNSVYLITGGAGGLGLLVARDIAANTDGATLVLTGRRPINDNITSSISALQASGAQVEYCQVDVTDAMAVKGLIAHIKDNYGELNAVLHSAGVLSDNFILNKDEADVQRVLAPKVSGLVNLDQSTKDLKLSHFVCFSSASILGNPGQADYAAANGFMDSYMQYRGSLEMQGQRHGQSIAINWPVWSDGGMTVNEAVQAQLRASGLSLLSSEKGLLALREILSLGQSGLLVFSGNGAQIEATLLSSEQMAPTQRITAAVSTDESSSGSLLETALAYFKGELSEALDIASSRIDVDAPMERYGIDSVMVLQLTGMLEKQFGGLPKTLFFEVQTIRALTEYFLKHHGETLRTLLGETSQQPEEKAEPVHSKSVAEKRQALRSKALQSKAPQLKATQLIPNDLLLASKGSGLGINQSSEQNTDIAIIGLSGRYAGAKNIDEFWQNLTTAKDCITKIPADRWDYRKYHDDDREAPGKSYCCWGSFIEDTDSFDPLFFNIAPTQAMQMDPHQRMILGSVWEALEVACYTPQRLEQQHQNKVGVYIGAWNQQGLGALNDPEDLPISSICSEIANRVSQYFGFEGPSLAIDTMCSSSTLAIHTACKDLRLEECEIALAGSVNLSLHPIKFIASSQIQLLGSHNGSRSFADGDGYLPAECVGAVLLKPLHKAIAEKDTIHAVIKGSACNHSGHSNGYMVPNLNAQVNVMQASIKNAGIDPQSISYIEAAANGSPFGDAVEVAALSKVFGADAETPKREQVQKRIIGTVKSNIGHPEVASGIAQLTKVVKQLQHKTFVPSIGMENPNPNMQLDGAPFEFATELTQWQVVPESGSDKTASGLRRALINSFGAGGTYVSLVVEEYSVDESASNTGYESTDSPQIIVLSAKDENRLTAVAKQLLTVLEKEGELSLANLAYTLQLGRAAMPVRLATVVSSHDELSATLKGFIAGEAAGQGKTLFTANIEQQPDLVNKKQAVIPNASGALTLQEMTEIAADWTKGADVAWQDLPGNSNRRFMSLPTYPFYQQKMSVNRVVQDVPESVSTAAKATDIALSDTAAATETHQKIAAKIPAHSQKQDIENSIRAFLTDKLGVPDTSIIATKVFSDYGMDSVLGLRLIRSLSKTFDVDINGRDLLEQNTLALLTEYVVNIINTGPRQEASQQEVSKQFLGEQGPGTQTSESIQELSQPDLDEELLAALEAFQKGDISIEALEEMLNEEFLV